MELDQEGKNLLALLVSRLSSAVPGQPQTYIGYKQCHDALGLSQMREKWGESLKAQGLASLAEWSMHKGFPGITGLVIDRTSNSPGRGYFNLFDKNEDDFKWWEDQIRLSKSFDWQPYISKEFTLVPSDLGAPEREEISVSRIIRDTATSKRVKSLNNHECQICGSSIEMPGGQRYAEAHHIKPLGEPHNGPDVSENMICVCPNDHARLDYGAIKLEREKIRFKPGHPISEEFLTYHNDCIHKP